MSTITDESNLFNFVITKPWLGQYSGSQGSQDFAGNFTSPTENYVATVQMAQTNSNYGLTHGFTTYFKMAGFNISTGNYEVWFSTGQPLLIPPSGNALSNIEVMATWIDR